MSVRTACIAGAAALVATAAACSSSPSSSANKSGPSNSAIATSAPKAGGSITVLESSGYSGAWSTLDPAQNKEGAATQDFMVAIYGKLFKLGPGTAPNNIVPDLASSYSISPDAKTITIQLRQGVTFTDNARFNATHVFR